MGRYSEDMDFSLLKEDSSFNIENYFPAIISEFNALGRDVIITKKEKKNFGKAESAFLKDDTHVYNLAFQTEKSIKIKSVPLDFEHFRQRALDFNGEVLTKDEFLEKLTNRMRSVDMNMVKNDVMPFVKNPSELDIWSNDYFIQLIEMMKFQENKS